MSIARTEGRREAPLSMPDERAPDPMVPRFIEVRRVVRETSDTVTLQLADAGASPFAPGQFNMLYLFGAGEVAISISSDPARPEALAHTVRGVGDVTAPLVAMKRGTMLGVRGPYGSAWPLAEAERCSSDILLVAGGIGLAPLRPVIYAVLRHRKSFGRLIVLYGARTPADLLYRKELERWRERTGVDLRIIVDRADSAWNGPVGILPQLLHAIRLEPARTIAMICGPEVMMRFVQRDLLARGLSAEDIYLSMERNMKCAVGFCGHCQFGPVFVCKDGPIFPLARVAPFLAVREF
jgi:NAD(P)H-flavin reductase